MAAYTIALAGNPNTGKSTLFNTLTGLRQHTGNWAGKTVQSAVGEFVHEDVTYRVIDLPGTYSLYSNSADEEVARDYIIFEQPDVTVVVVDATSLERNLNLALQVMEMTNRVVLCVNLIDEAKRLGIHVDVTKIRQKLGVPTVAISARNRTGIDALLAEVEKVASGKIIPQPVTISYSADIEQKIRELEPQVTHLLGTRFSPRWIALRLLDGDEKLLASLKARLDTVGATGMKEVVPHEQISCH